MSKKAKLTMRESPKYLHAKAIMKPGDDSINFILEGLDLQLNSPGHQQLEAQVLHLSGRVNKEREMKPTFRMELIMPLHLTYIGYQIKNLITPKTTWPEFVNKINLSWKSHWIDQFGQLRIVDQEPILRHVIEDEFMHFELKIPPFSRLVFKDTMLLALLSIHEQDYMKVERNFGPGTTVGAGGAPKLIEEYCLVNDTAEPKIILGEPIYEIDVEPKDFVTTVINQPKYIDATLNGGLICTNTNLSLTVKSTFSIQIAPFYINMWIADHISAGLKQLQLKSELLKVQKTSDETMEIVFQPIPASSRTEGVKIQIAWTFIPSDTSLTPIGEILSPKMETLEFDVTKTSCHQFFIQSINTENVLETFFPVNVVSVQGSTANAFIQDIGMTCIMAVITRVDAIFSPFVTITTAQQNRLQLQLIDRRGHPITFNDKEVEFFLILQLRDIE